MKLKLLEKKEEVPGVISFIFEPQEKLSWEAGQFLHYVLHHEPTDDRGSDRWFTVSAAPYEGHVMLTTRFTDSKGSSFKNKLKDFKIGKSLEISFLEGDFVLDDPEKDYVFIAGGIGITPFRSILRQLDHEKKTINVTLLYSNRDQNIVFKNELEEVAERNSNFKIHYVFSPEHIDENKIKEFVPDLQKPVFYVSGPEPMVEDLGSLLKKMGVKDENLKQDWFPGYPAE